MANNVLLLNQNVETRTKLTGIAKNVSYKSLASWLSRGSSVLSTEQEIRNTKKVDILIPFMVGTRKISDILDEAKAGGVKTSDAPLAQRSFTLENELATDPIIYRPRSAEQLEASELLGRYQDGFTIGAQITKDAEYLMTTLANGVSGLSTGEKMEIINTDTTTRTWEDEGKELEQKIKSAIERLQSYKDKQIGGAFEPSDFSIVATPKTTMRLMSSDKYLIRTDVFANSNPNIKTTGDGTEALFNGMYPFKTSKGLLGVKYNGTFIDLDFVVMINSSAVSGFLFLDAMNNDKIPGVNAYKLSLEMNVGTGVYYPQLITAGTLSENIPAQDAVGSGTIDFTENLVSATTESK